MKKMVEITDQEIAEFRASTEFDERWYAEQYPDVAQTGMDPARHYLWIGRRLGRKPSPAAHSMPLRPGADLQPDAQIHAVEQQPRITHENKSKTETWNDHVYQQIAAYFDSDFYRTKYPDIAVAGIDPIRHYLDTGWREGRDPSLEFSTQFYVENNPDVVAAGVNPYYHYLVAGKAEGRPGKHRLGFRWDILTALKPVEQRIREIKASRSPVLIDKAASLEDSIRMAFRRGQKLILSFSHDNFTQSVGGIQLLLRRELALFKEADALHVHIFPVFHLPFLDVSGDEVILGVLVNGKLAGSFLSEDISSTIQQIRSDAASTSFVIHSLLGHNMDQAIRIIDSINCKNGYLWVHDYSPLYNNYNLLRNDVEYCGYPKPGSVARNLCEYARADFDHAEEFAKLFNKFNITLLSPSESALAIWRSSEILKPANVRIIPHVQLERKASSDSASLNPSAPLRVGFLGFPAAHKGWPVFEELVLKYGEDPRYQFMHLGKGRQGGLKNLGYREVVANEDRLDAMSQAVAEVKLDVAVVWSICPETFCLTAYEALAGGAALVTNPSAGNVVSVTEQSGLGMIFPDEKALNLAFENGEVRALSRRNRPPSEHTIQYSNLSLEVMDQK